MWLTNWTTSQGNVTYLSFKSSQAYPTPCFVKKKWDDVETFTTLQWQLISIETKEGKYWTEIIFNVVDQWDKYVVQFWINNNLTTSILNSLSGVEKFNYIEISCYSKDWFWRVKVKTSTDWNVFTDASWKYTVEEIKALTKKVKVNGSDVTDKTDLFEVMINGMIPDINMALESF